jgi:hypothetical protein
MKKAPLVMHEDGYGLEENLGYYGLIESCGLKIESSASLGDYQGDLFFLIRDPETGLWAFGRTGYGSCSGCDAWEACESLQDYEGLRNSLVDGLIWKTTAEMLVWFSTKDWTGEYWGADDPEFSTWVEKVKEILTVAQ